MQPDLIARIEKATPSEARELFDEAFRIAFPVPKQEDEPEWQGPGTLREPLYHHWYLRADSFTALRAIGTPEALLGAAAMFVPDGWNWMAGNRNQPAGRAWVENGAPSFVGFGTQRNPARKWYEVVATTPYFALLAAAMKARQTDERD
jgi:hypothetical protein